MLVLVLLVAAGGSALFLTNSGKKATVITRASTKGGQTQITTGTTHPTTSATDTSSASGSLAAGGQTSTVTATTDTSPATQTSTTTTTSSSNANLAASGAPPVSSAAGAALQHYWTLVNEGKYAEAFAMETPHEQAQEPSFVSDKSTGQPMINVVSIGQASSNSGDADVQITFYAQDRQPSPGSDTICRYFAMTAHMVQNSDGTWSYDGPTSGSANVTDEPGSRNCHS